jgi:hypothetical protein
VLGVSLGGHAAWQVFFNEPRVTAAVVIIGCPDYIRESFLLYCNLTTKMHYCSKSGGRLKELPKCLGARAEAFELEASATGRMCFKAQ